VTRTGLISSFVVILGLATLFYIGYSTGAIKTVSAEEVEKIYPPIPKGGGVYWFPSAGEQFANELGKLIVEKKCQYKDTIPATYSNEGAIIAATVVCQ